MTTADMGALEPGRAYEITFECRDIGYGPETGSGEYVYRGVDAWGKRAFAPVGGGETVYLFADEITGAWTDR
jgi:hypothetical protein